MSPRSRDGRLRLLEPLATDLAAFRAALGIGASEIGLVRAAVRAYIDAWTEKDDRLRGRYMAERDKLNAAKRQPLRLVQPNESGGK